MTAAATTAAGLAGVAALADWWAVDRSRRSVEYVAKPAVLAALVVVAVTLDPDDGDTRAWFVAGLVASLVGDVVLMLPAGPFVAGLGAFLVAHLLYIAGFLVHGVEPGWAALGLVVALGAAVLVGPPLLRGVAGTDRTLLGPVVGYIAAISAMVALAVGTGDVLAGAGALAFFASDAVLGWRRFVRPFPHNGIAVHVPYHLGQAMLVAWLAA